MSHIRRSPLVLIFALCLLGLGGCGGHKGGIVKGTLVLPPNVKPGETDSLTVLFRPEEGTGESAPAPVNVADMSFSAKGATGKGVAPGKYKLIISLQPYMGSAEAEKRRPLYDAINNKYDEKNTKLSYDVTNEAQQSIVVDLAKGTVTKQ
jgi:hypothetical protein